MPRRLFRKVLPSPQWVREQRFLKWLRPVLHHPRLWHVSRGGIALGCAVGVFFGVLLPTAQIPAAAAMAVFVRANLPMAVVGTFITNPFTFAPVYYLAYQIGLLFCGIEPQSLSLHEMPASNDLLAWADAWLVRLRGLGKPLLFGLPMLASISAMLTYLLVNRLWRVYAIRAWNKRRIARQARIAGG